MEDATSSFQLQPGIVDHLQQQYADTLADSEVSFSIFTEMYVNGELYRAHPNYQQKGPWYDWVIVRWERQEDQHHLPNAADHPYLSYGEDDFENHHPKDHIYNPAKLLGFYIDFDGIHQAIMETCEYEDYSQSVFSSLYKRTFDGHTTKPYVMSIDVWAFVRCCLIIPYDSETGKVIYVWPREVWADEFYKT